MFKVSIFGKSRTFPIHICQIFKYFSRPILKMNEKIFKLKSMFLISSKIEFDIKEQIVLFRYVLTQVSC